MVNIMNNTIILKKGYARLTDSEYENFTKGDTISGNDSNPEELKRWSIDHEEEAKEELKKYNCTYKNDYGWNIEEYALEYCECDEEGEFVVGSDYEMATEKRIVMTLETVEEIEVGMEVRFAELWDGEGDGEELLQSGTISPDNDNVVTFKVVEDNSNILDTIVRVIDIY